MNERLTKLAQQANMEFTYDPTEPPVRAFVECWEDELEKFAEMIIRECAKVSSDQVMDVEGNDWGVSWAVKKHFGVQE